MYLDMGMEVQEIADEVGMTQQGVHKRLGEMGILREKILDLQEYYPHPVPSEHSGSRVAEGARFHLYKKLGKELTEGQEKRYTVWRRWHERGRIAIYLPGTGWQWIPREPEHGGFAIVWNGDEPMTQEQRKVWSL
ncbi:hypothetical protein FGW37_05300 [Streptomyces rectiverticillatus]|uniref:hypothetical protein n=1 Tax=Streptomyces rectiverticillatus TaxID=173860 RepID=UPI0015C2FDB3|nr:hypothetical protein [Streptomyces rectiverticillatus]QLE71097.1 hypothetical protein FGW37_05300 [Streptomyces rectiverticillatus]